MALDTAARWAIILLAVIAGFAALKLAADVFAPLVLGLVIGVVLSPISHFIERRGAPSWLSALAVMSVSLLLLAGILVFLGPVFSRLLTQAPQIWL
jgi:predicted PurR-regulated permease PerM